MVIMNKQKFIFFLVVGSAIIVVGVVSILNGGLGAVRPEATTTESVIRKTATQEGLVSDVMSGKQTWNGLQIAVIGVEENGWPLVEAHNQYNDPPLPGKQMLLITVQVKNMERDGGEPISIDESDFVVVGELGEVYNTYSEETRCGVVPDKLDGVVTYDHAISGAICVQVPEHERGFILVYDDAYGGDPAVYIPLPEGE